MGDRSLFEEEASLRREAAPAPLATRLRPRSLDEVVGQQQLLGPGTVLRRAIERDELGSAIFWGPPGCGKSTVALLIAAHTRAHFEPFSAVVSGIPEVRKAIEAARQRQRATGQRTILFVDEIHRFNRAQQDAFLPHVEDGTVLLIGATTENPYFEVNAPLVSRSRIYRFELLADEDVRQLIRRALEDQERGLGRMNVRLDPEAEAHLVAVANGDARNALNALELAAQAAPVDEAGARRVTLELAEQAIQQRALLYDKTGDQHYDVVSAFIKSMRGSDPDAAVYWLHRMLAAGEDPRFIARRMVIHAAEDVGLADPLALVVATAAAHAVEYVGLPEAQIPMTEAAIYIATAPKSNAVVRAISKVQQDLRERRQPPVPPHLRDTSYRGASALGHGAGYKYPHDYPGSYVPQQYVPEGATSGPYYEPTDNGHEATVRERLEAWRRRGGEKARPDGEPGEA
ncbi:MAG: replication-associated recombination protein A [Armatimonadetes bacterium]|nr:replication-associated recombination protein A [Armatimonadota bacterium]